ncbi:hypothetical protein PVK06_044725 [Gossypium arboreum]|uniref:RNase H type-1 domain-containing protein n=1 Tax=Gossypium arboreum TaxID=29729 RepID=A0ABR0MTY9_GOSAR|nr:hypothetical protein PVK06_044725 [Gossypium arboreum]
MWIAHVNNKTKCNLGGVVRGPNRGWMEGFKIMIGLSDIFQVEARALFEGLKFAWAQGFCLVEIESDNALLIAVIQDELAASSKYSEIRQIMMDNNEWLNILLKRLEAKWNSYLSMYIHRNT